MASIITATTANGLVSSADNSGVLQLASGTGNLVTVPSVTGTAMVSGNMPAFSVYLNGSQTISASTWTKITLNAEDFDTNNNFASNRFTPTVAGYYLITVVSQMAGTGLTYPNVGVYKNGTLWGTGNSTSNSTSEIVCSGSTLVYLNGSTDYIEMYIQSFTAAGSVTVRGDARTQTVMAGVLVRGA